MIVIENTRYGHRKKRSEEKKVKMGCQGVLSRWEFIIEISLGLKYRDTD